MSQVDEQYLREQIDRILREQWGDGLGELEFGELEIGGDAQQFYDTFIGPFVDVVKVANVAIRQTADAALSMLDQITTFDLNKKKQIQDQFRANRQEYAKEMADAMKNVNDTFNHNDTKLLMFMMNPGAYMGAAMTQAAVDSKLAQPATDFVASKLGGFATDLGWGKEARGVAAPKVEPDRGPLRGLMNDLKVLFFGEGLDEIDEIEMVLAEQEEKKEKKAPSESEIEAAFEEQYADMGLEKRFKSYQDEIISSKKEEIEAIKAEVEGQILAVSALQAAKSLQDIQDPVQKLKEFGVDLTPIAAEIEKQFASQSESIRRGDEDGKELMAQLGETPEGSALSPERPDDYLPVLEQSLLAAGFGEAAQKVKESFGGDIVGFVKEVSDAELDEMAKSPVGKEYVSVVKEFEDWFNSTLQ